MCDGEGTGKVHSSGGVRLHLAIWVLCAVVF